MATLLEVAQLQQVQQLQQTALIKKNFVQLDPGVVLTLPPPVNVSPKVISQTPAQGSFVPRGSKVNLTLGNGRTLPATVVQGGLASWNTLTLGTLYDQNLAGDPLVDGLVAKFDQQGALSTSEQTLLQNTLSAKGVQFGSGTGSDINAALQSLVAARTFNGLGV
ncbi:MAG: hypothetical protein RIQ60_675 [Pseudomonadota bacterium]|jgi:hypothetical protein